MPNTKGIHLIYKKVGETPLEAISRFKKTNPKLKEEKMTYAGRLDPMAEGALLILSGKKVKEKDKYLDLSKTYEFQILWGISTDTHDLLGRVAGHQDFNANLIQIKNLLQKSKGKFEQAYPIFSSKTVRGKPLFYWAREGRLDEIKTPKHLVEIFSTKFIGRKSVLGAQLLDEINSKIKLVSGDFRQKEIISDWKKNLGNRRKEMFIIDKIQIKVSSGFYIRQFVSDFAKKMETEAVAFSINRTKIGRFKS